MNTNNISFIGRIAAFFRFDGKVPVKRAGSALLTLAAALGLWFFVAAHYRVDALSQAGSTLSTINSDKASQISSWYGYHEREALRLSRHSFLGEIVSQEISNPGSRRAQLTPWLIDHAEQKRYSSMAFMSTKGAVILASPGHPAGREKEFAEGFAQAVKKNKALVTDLYLAADGKPRLSMFSPISLDGRGKKTICVLAVNIDPGTELYQLVKAAPLFRADAETILVRKEGDSVLYLNELEYLKDAALKLRRPLSDKRLPAAAALSGRTGFFEGVDYRGVKVFSAGGPVKGTAWAVVTKIDSAALLAPARRMQHLWLAVILLAAAVLYSAARLFLFYREQAGREALNRSEAALRVSEAIFREFMEHSPIYVFFKDENIRALHLSRNFEKMVGKPLGEMLGKSMDELFPSDLAKGMVADDMRVLREGKEVVVEEELNGRSYVTTKFPITIPGKPPYLAGFTIDITERKRAEEARELNSRRMQSLLKLNQMTEATLQEITDFTLEAAVQLTQSRIGYLAFLNEDETVLTMHSWSRSAMAECAIDQKPIVYPVVTTGLWGEAVRQRRPVITNDYAADNPLKKGYPQGHVAVKRHMNVPVFAGSRIVIVAGVGNKPGEYDQDDAQQLTLLMEAMWRLLERKKAADALQESEAAVRAKLQALLSPEGELGTLELGDILDVPALQAIMDEFYKLTNIGMAIVDMKGKVLLGTGWQDICTKFHRVNPETLRNCVESDTLLSAGVEPGKCKEYLCKNNLRDIATPIMVGGKHLGNLFIGQFLYTDEPDDPELFRRQARRYGFDEKEYLAAYERLPRFGREQVDVVMRFFIKFEELVSALSYGKIKLARALARSGQAQEALLKSKADKEATLENLLVGVVIHAPDTSIISSNQEAQRILGLTAAQMSGKQAIDPAWRFVHEDLRRVDLADYPVNKVISAKAPLSNLLLGILRPDRDHVTWVTVGGIPMFAENGSLEKVVINFVDITARKRAELELEKLNRDLAASKKEMENFLYITTHDLRSPLVNIQGFSQNLRRYAQELLALLSRVPLPPEDRKAAEELTGESIPGALKFVLESSRKMDGLITALLKVSRIGRVEMKPETVEMNGLIKKIGDTLHYQLEAAGGEIRCGALPPCKADPVAVSQLFGNLLDNAIKYRAKDRPLLITVSGEVKGGMALYAVADNGSGIEETDLQRIWNVFYRGGRPAGGKGEGIGLALVRRIAEKNGGNIRVESKEGEGSVFYVDLPGAQEEI